MSRRRPPRREEITTLVQQALAWPHWSSKEETETEEELKQKEEEETEQFCNYSIENKNEHDAQHTALSKVFQDPSLSCLILRHLELTELAACSLVSHALHQACRSNALWKGYQWPQRWTYDPTKDDEYANANDKEHGWYRRYVQAHLHPHDLWVFHEACVPPWDGAIVSIPLYQKNNTSPTASSTAAWTCAITRPDPQSILSQYQRRDFLSDLVFFNLTDPSTVQGTYEERAWRTEKEILGHDDTLNEVTNHSWHQIRLVNPHLYRPLVYKFAVSDEQCFAVFPSQGYLGPGQSRRVTVSVRPLGGRRAFAVERPQVELDAFQDNNDQDVPFGPLVIRYRWVPRSPGKECHPNTAASAAMRNDTPTTEDPRDNTLNHATRRADERITDVTAQMLKTFWNDDTCEHEYRSLYLSAHVHAYYNYWDFVQLTCSTPFSTSQKVIFSAPNLELVYPDVYERARRRLLGDSANTSRVLNKWTRHLQERGRQRDLLTRNMAVVLGTCLEHQQQNTDCKDSNSKQVDMAMAQLLQTIWSQIQGYKATPWRWSSCSSDRQQRQDALARLELLVDELYQTIPVGGEQWYPWRFSGVFRARTSTSFNDDLDSNYCYPGGKDEPESLDGIRHLKSVNQANLGRPQDPRKVHRYHDPDSMVPSNPLRTLQAGLSLIQDPRGLLAHGLYTYIPYPGSVARRPKLLLTALGREQDETPCHNKTLDLDYGLLHFVHGAPPPGIGRFPLSTFGFTRQQDQSGDNVDRTAADSEEPSLSIVELKLGEEESDGSIDGNTRRATNSPPAAHIPPQDPRQAPQNVQPLPLHPPNFAGNGPRLVQLLWMLGAQAGLVMVDQHGTSSPSILVERPLLIGLQWCSLLLGIVPLMLTLFARGVARIPTQPADYYFIHLPFESTGELQYLNPRECGYVAFVFLWMFLVLMRWTERHVRRDGFCILAEYERPINGRSSFGGCQRGAWRVWDATCPLVLQQLTGLVPPWNRLTDVEWRRRVGGWRSREPPVQQGVVSASTSLNHDQSLLLGKTSLATKMTLGLAILLVSFCATSPQVGLNAVSIFSSSLGLGLSVSTQALELGRLSIMVQRHQPSSWTIWEQSNVVTIVVGAVMLGQIVGSSGGTLFLAEFIVTCISFLIGGTGTLSASAMESWVCFFGLSWISFWGYMSGRVALLDSVGHKRAGYASILLSNAIRLLVAFWVLIFWLGEFEFHTAQAIRRYPDDSASVHGKSYGYYMARIQ